MKAGKSSQGREHMGKMRKAIVTGSRECVRRNESEFRNCAIRK